MRLALRRLLRLRVKVLWSSSIHVVPSRNSCMTLSDLLFLAPTRFARCGGCESIEASDCRREWGGRGRSGDAEWLSSSPLSGWSVWCLALDLVTGGSVAPGLGWPVKSRL